MYAFDYKRAATLEEARKALEGIAESKLLAGGMSIVPVLRYRLAQPSALIDLGKIEALKGVSEADNTIRIGAMTTHYAVSRSELVRNKIPALAQLAGGIGDPLVRNRGTIGGSLAHNDPAACYPSSILALGATIHTDRRDIEADNFIVGTFHHGPKAQRNYRRHQLSAAGLRSVHQIHQCSVALQYRRSLCGASTRRRARRNNRCGRLCVPLRTD